MLIMFLHRKETHKRIFKECIVTRHCYLSIIINTKAVQNIFSLKQKYVMKSKTTYSSIVSSFEKM